MAALSLQGLHKRFGTQHILRGVDLEVRDGEFMVFVGPSGCGKTTTLRMIAGLEDIAEGELRIAGRRANEQGPAERGAAMVFQSYALYPHMTVAENLGFALKMAGVARREREQRVREVAATLRLSELLERRPAALSGGQRQRVAIGRAIVRRPKVFLFDEPLSNLDAALRVEMRIELARLHRQLGSTMIYVTHDQTEAMTLGQRIAVFHQGRIEQVGAPLELYERPASEFVAGFIGAPRINLVERPHEQSAAAHRRLWADLGQDGAARIGLRPEQLQLCAAAQGLPGRVELAEQLGDCSLIHLEVEGLARPLVLRLGAEGRGLAREQTVHWRLAPGGKALRFDAQGRCLS